MWTIDDLQKAEVVENGPVISTLKIERKFLDSTVIQYMHIYKDL